MFEGRHVIEKLTQWHLNFNYQKDFLLKYLSPSMSPWQGPLLLIARLPGPPTPLVGFLATCVSVTYRNIPLVLMRSPP